MVNVVRLAPTPLHSNSRGSCRRAGTRIAYLAKGEPSGTQIWVRFMDGEAAPTQNDLRTPISQTEEFYEALKVRKVPTAMIRFNDEWHGTSSRPSNYLRTQLYLRSWFEKYSNKDDKVAVQ